MITELISAVISPLGTSLLAGLAALHAGFKGSQRRAAAAGAFALAWLWLWSLPLVSVALRASLEQEFPSAPLQSIPSAAAAVVLGGALTPAPKRDQPPDLNSAADRVWHAARLYHAGKVRLLVLSGGSDPAISATSEAQTMRTLLLDLGVPAEAMLLEETSRSTRENAQFTAALLRARGIDEVLVVTSALHMRRALASFRAAGLRPVPAATDYEARCPTGAAAWIPSAAALDGSARAFKELIGRWVA